MVKNTYGTGCFMLMHTGHNRGAFEKRPADHAGLPDSADDRRSMPWKARLPSPGALVQWLRDGLGIIETAPEVETLARTVEDNGGIYFVPAFSGLFAPYWKKRCPRRRRLA